MRIILPTLFLLLQGCEMLAGVNSKGEPSGPGLIDAVAGVAHAIPGYGTAAAVGLGTVALLLRSYLIRRAGRKDDNLNGVADDLEGKKRGRNRAS